MVGRRRADPQHHRFGDRSHIYGDLCDRPAAKYVAAGHVGPAEGWTDTYRFKRKLERVAADVVRVSVAPLHNDGDLFMQSDFRCDFDGVYRDICGQETTSAGEGDGFEQRRIERGDVGRVVTGQVGRRQESAALASTRLRLSSSGWGVGHLRDAEATNPARVS